MQDEGRTLHCPLNGGRIGQAPFDQLDPWQDILKIGSAAGRKIVKYPYPFAPRGQFMSQVRADEARSTCNKIDSHGSHPCSSMALQRFSHGVTSPVTAA